MNKYSLWQWINHTEVSCLLCQRKTLRSNVCSLCVNDLPRLTGVCQLCALPLPFGKLCGPCLLRPPPWHAMHCAYAYEEPIRQLLHQLKFGGNTFAALALAELMPVCWDPHNQPDVIIPLPLHWTRLWRRGFNQSQELAIPLGRRLNIAVATNLLVRRKRTPAQSSLNYRQRKRNVRDAFVASAEVTGMHVALLDDVVTTGATVTAATRALVAQGCARIEVLSCARVLGRQ